MTCNDSSVMQIIHIGHTSKLDKQLSTDSLLFQLTLALTPYTDSYDTDAVMLAVIVMLCKSSTCVTHEN